MGGEMSINEKASVIRIYDEEVYIAIRIGAAMRNVSASKFAEDSLRDLLIPKPPEKEQGSKN